jgi:hypothetical protein
MISFNKAFKSQKRLFDRELKFISVWIIFSRILPQIRNLYLKRIETILDETYVITVGSHKISEDYLQKDAFEHLPIVKTHIKNLNIFNKKLEDAEYPCSKAIESKFNLVLDAVYELDISIKMKSYAGLPKIGTDPEILHNLSSMSKEAIESVLSARKISD